MTLLVALGLAGALMQTPAGADSAVVSGRVLEQGTHAPVAGAQVTLMVQFQGPPPMPFPRPATATTDQNGRFVFANVEPGRYRVNAQKTGFAISNGPAIGNLSPTVEVKAGERPAAVEITLQRGGVIAGRVVDQSGEPLVDARVMVLRRLQAPPNASPRAGASATAFAAAMLPDRLMMAGPGGQTNDLGEFRLHSLAPGEYYVQAAPRAAFMGDPSGSGTTGGATTMVATYFPGTTDAAAAQPIMVSAGQTSGNVELRMIVATASQVSGVVADEAGRPIANAMVRLTARDQTATRMVPMMMRPNQAKTDAKGAFVIGGVTNGAYTLIAVPPVVTATGPQVARGAVGAGASGFSFVGGGRASGARGAVTTESINGTTVEYRDETGTQLAIDVNEGNVTKLQLIVHRPASK
jgi:protocatechuate 3,4-dioxygenase beta subunit